MYNIYIYIWFWVDNGPLQTRWLSASMAWSPIHLITYNNMLQPNMFNFIQAMFNSFSILSSSKCLQLTIQASSVSSNEQGRPVSNSMNSRFGTNGPAWVVPKFQTAD